MANGVGESAKPGQHGVRFLLSPWLSFGHRVDPLAYCLEGIGSDLRSVQHNTVHAKVPEVFQVAGGELGIPFQQQVPADGAAYIGDCQQVGQGQRLRVSGPLEQHGVNREVLQAPQDGLFQVWRDAQYPCHLPLLQGVHQGAVYAEDHEVASLFLVALHLGMLQPLYPCSPDTVLQRLDRPIQVTGLIGEYEGVHLSIC